MGASSEMVQVVQCYAATCLCAEDDCAVAHVPPCVRLSYAKLRTR